MDRTSTVMVGLKRANSVRVAVSGWPSVQFLLYVAEHGHSISSLKRFVGDPSRLIEDRKFAMFQVVTMTTKPITWLRTIEESEVYPQELRDAAQKWITVAHVYKKSMAVLRRHGLA